MYVKRSEDVFTKLSQMGDVTLYEPAGDTPHSEATSSASIKRQRSGFDLADCISHVQTPRGSKPILKTMVTTACERNCNYCPFRAGHSSTRRTTMTPDEIAYATDTMQRSKQIDGLFLSSGIIKGGVSSQDKIIDAAEILRKKYHYRGYVHLKIMPGAEYDQLYRAMQLADRVSINLEGPTAERLEALAPKKGFMQELLVQLQRAHHIKQNDPRIRSSIVTQFVVGAVGDTDLELLSLSDRLYNQLGLARTYYSGFSPIAGTPFENVSPTAKIRQNRLYQSSFLLRDYQWDVEDLPFLFDGNLRTDVDPKQAWADLHLKHQPIDLMNADRSELLRVPGIGLKAADTILSARKERKLIDLGQLAHLGIRNPQQMAPYVLLDGHRPAQQLSLF
ncbi:radical SAM protein [Phototrophicus methaneseepsis]|uniref:Radical SAM protein n=1 Tax=Phototrophicus methaneseepsis TaxID=2710758 RepID=A0A7S8E551_9CHLR|nr:radical SAM protein [Phototrophicus methaneseepsis]QPC80540.1 radical SAM protein [Phototrophicus methaneseepsis]